jgi:hypothetical protein
MSHTPPSRENVKWSENEACRENVIWQWSLETLQRENVKWSENKVCRENVIQLTPEFVGSHACREHTRRHHPAPHCAEEPAWLQGPVSCLPYHESANTAPNTVQDLHHGTEKW